MRILTMVMSNELRLLSLHTVKQSGMEAFSSLVFGLQIDIVIEGAFVVGKHGYEKGQPVYPKLRRS